MVDRLRVSHSSSPLSDKERELLAATVGDGRYRVLTRWPLTVAFAPRAWLPGLAGAVLAFAMLHGRGPLAGLGAAAIAVDADTAPIASTEKNMTSNALRLNLLTQFTDTAFRFVCARSRLAVTQLPPAALRDACDGGSSFDEATV